jgi:hypothetical protein
MLSQESPSGKDGKYQGLIGTTLGHSLLELPSTAKRFSPTATMSNAGLCRMHLGLEQSACNFVGMVLILIRHSPTC